MIDRATVERIMDAAQIVDVVSEFVTLRKAGANYKGLCPFHDDHTPSFVVSPAKGLCKCFACGKGGNAVGFIMLHEQLTYPEALRWLAHKYHIEIDEREPSDEERRAQNEREGMFVLNEWAADFFQHQLYHTDEGRAYGMSYFRTRAFRDDIINKFRLGYCPRRRDALATEAKAKGYSEELLLATGLCIKNEQTGRIFDRFSGRVIFPILSLSGKVAGFGARVLNPATKGVNLKYMNSPESAVYSKKKELYGLYLAKQAIAKQDFCYLVEGYTDVIAMHQMGVENVVASSGTALTTEQIHLIHRFTNNITILYDGDAAGIKASQRGTDLLLAAGMNVKLLLIPDDDDPDSFARKHSPADYQNYLATHQTDFIKYKTHLLLSQAQNDPVKLSNLVGSIVHTIALVPNPITRSLYVKQAATMLQIDERHITAAVAKERKSNAKNPAPASDNTNARPVPPANTLETDKPLADELFLKKERLLIQAVIRYGEQIMCETTADDGTTIPVSVAQYVTYALSHDGLELHNPLHRRILAEAESHAHEPEWKACPHFLKHPDPNIATLAFQLADNKYELSKIHARHQKVEDDANRLETLVPHLVDDFKLAVIDAQLQHLQLQLRRPDIMTHKDEYINIMTRYKEIKDIERRLAHNRGDRVIL